MKKLQFSFAAIIAIVAISITVVVQAGSFETKSIRPPGLDELDCFRPSTSSTGKLLCSTTTPAQLSATTCASANSNYTNMHLFAVSTINFIEEPDAQLVCPDTQGQFCCFQVAVDPAPCQGQPQLNLCNGLKFYRVSQIRCIIP